MKKLLIKIDEKIERVRHNLHRAEVALDHGMGNDFQVAIFRAKIEAYQDVKGLIAERLVEQMGDFHA